METRPVVVPHEAAMLGGVALCAAYMMLTGLAQYAVVTVAALIPAAIIAHQLARHPERYGLPWRLLGIAVSLQALRSIARVVRGLVEGELVAPTVFSQASLLVSFVIMLAATLAILAPYARAGYGLIAEAAVSWIAGAGVLWATLIAPALTAQGATTSRAAVILVLLLVLSGISGTILQVAILTPPARGPLLLIGGAAVLALTSNLITTVDPPPHAGPGPVGLLNVLGYCVLAAAALHPARGAVTFAVPIGAARPQDRLTRTHLVTLGVALAVNPLVAGVHAINGQRVDGPVLVATTLAIVPLVVWRTTQMVQAQKDAEETLRHVADHCEMTGLLNRRRGLDELAASIDLTRAATEHDDASTLALFVDIDDLKGINDTHGHVAGDGAVKAVAAAISAAVGASGVVARIGGDEFLVVTRTGLIAADRLVTTVREAVRALVVVVPNLTAGGEPTMLDVSATVGAHRVAPGSSATVADVLARADHSMYAAKPSTAHD